jgi:hypothetical protein
MFDHESKEYSKALEKEEKMLNRNEFDWENQKELVKKPTLESDIVIVKSPKQVKGVDRYVIKFNEVVGEKLKGKKLVIGFSSDGKKLGFMSTDESVGHNIARRVKSNKCSCQIINKNMAKLEEFVGNHNARYTEDGVVYISLNDDKSLIVNTIQEKLDKLVECPVEVNEVVNEVEEKPYISEELYRCKFCGGSIRFLVRPNRKGIPLEYAPRYFTIDPNGPISFYDENGEIHRGFMYSKKYANTIKGYVGHSNPVCKPPRVERY